MSFFTDLKTSLKQKWLEFFQVNRYWVARHMELEYVATPDGGRRPSSHLILGVVSALEPQLTQLLEPFTKLNPDINALVDVLELNFDPEKFQGNSMPANPYSNLSASDESMEALMGVMDDTPELSELSLVQVVDKTAPERVQQNPLPPLNQAQSEVGDTRLELNQETTQESDLNIDKTRAREQKQSEDNEISRLFPDL